MLIKLYILIFTGSAMSSVWGTDAFRTQGARRGLQTLKAHLHAVGQPIAELYCKLSMHDAQFCGQ